MGGAGVDGDDSPVEAYLDRAFDLLAGSGPAGRRAFAELDDHLREATQAGVASGLTRAEAELAAVRRFGPPERVVPPLVRADPLAGLRRLVSSAAVLGGIGLLAIGVSGLVAGLLGLAFGKPFVSGDGPGVTYTSQRCADFLEYHPEAGSCSAAAVAHHFDEVVFYRLYAGVLGLLALAGLGLLLRVPRLRALWAPRADLVAVVGAGAFGAAALVLGGAGVMEVVRGIGGAGQLVSAGLVAAVALAAFLPLLWRSLRARPG